MASSKENKLAQVFLAIGHGAGDAHLPEASVAWLFDRYSKWLDEKTSTGQTPQEVWPKHGSAFLKQFTAIGRAIGSRSPSLTAPAPLSPVDLEALVCGVEGESDCPYCPSQPKG